MTLDTPLSAIPIIKKPQLSKLAHLGLETIYDLLLHLPTAPVLALSNLSAYNNQSLPALSGVSLDIFAGEIVGLAGVSGSGINRVAVGATLVGCALAWVGAFVPALKAMYDYAWFVGAFSSAGLYALGMKVTGDRAAV